MTAAKELMRAALLSAPGRVASRLLARDTVTIVMLHRFSDERAPSGGHTTAELRGLLQTLRDLGAPIVPLVDLARPGATPPPGAIAFTVDDGYADFTRIAWPVFREFDCPVTVFLTTGFLDGLLWPWWERILWATEHTRAPTLHLVVAGEVFERALNGEEARYRVAAELIERLKRVPDAEREAALAALPNALEVVIPGAPPAEHAAMTWDDVRRAGKEGATFGPHTITHPILSRVDDARAETEIVGSWERVRAETDSAIPVFCYPNGDRDSFGAREEAIVARQHLALAVTAVPGNATTRDFAPGAPRRFRLPRYACPRDPRTLRWLASGWERLRGGQG